MAMRSAVQNHFDAPQLPGRGNISEASLLIDEDAQALRLEMVGEVVDVQSRGQRPASTVQ